MNRTQDSRQSVREILTLTEELEEALQARDLDEVFRVVHSVKSIAAQAGVSKLASNAHEVEGELEALRSGAVDFDPAIERRIRELILEAQADLTSDDSAGTDGETVSGIRFNQFEHQLLEEGIRRGERFYRVVCAIDSDSPFKIPRAHLVINNLELIANVIKSEPPLTLDDDSAFTRVAVYLSTAVDERELYDAVNVDEVAKIQIGRLSSDGSVSISDAEEIPEPSFVRISAPYRIDPRTFDWLLSKIDEVDSIVHTVPVGADRKLRHLRSLVSGIRESLRATRSGSLAYTFSRLESATKELSDGLEKIVTFHSSGRGVSADSRIVYGLYDPLLHLVRNAVDHGIEAPPVRRKAGKPDNGTIEISAQKSLGSLELRVKDDGTGIDWSTLREKAKKRGIDASDTIGLLSTPGLSTSQTPSELSGRGVGLDVVVQRIRSAGGTVDVESEAGVGTTFVVTIPDETVSVASLVVRHRDRHYALSLSDIERVIPLEIASVKRDSDGRLWFERKPMYDVEGRLTISRGVSRNGTLLMLRFNEKSGWLLVDDVLFERQGVENTAASRIAQVDVEALLG